MDIVSYSAFEIRMLKSGLPLATGTAFLYLYANTHYIITNWHNVSGRETNLKPKDKDLVLPDEISFDMTCLLGTQIGRFPFNLKLYNDEYNVEAKWLEHPQGRKVDVVAIPICVVGNPDLDIPFESWITANDQRFGLRKIVLSVSMDVFILGYPVRLSGGSGLPIWKRGSIASEPDIDIEELPKLYIDTATREGMSGAPVYAQPGSAWEDEDRRGLLQIEPLARKFLGIYSGRVGTDSFLAQLGIVWKEKAIIEIITSGRQGVSSYELTYREEDADS